MKKLFSNKYFILLLVITIALLGIMTVYTTKRESVSIVEDITGAVLAPVQKLFSGMSLNTIGFFSYFTDLNKLRQENDELTARITALEDETREIEMYRYENKRLRTMLDFKQTLNYSTISSEVIAKDAGTWYSTFTLDKGAADGVGINMEVTTEDGLVGHIYEVGTNWSKAISILELQNAVGCLVTRTRDIAVVEGDVLLKEEGLLKMTYLEKDGTIMVGDKLETSGLGSIYNKKGLLIGEITEIVRDSTSILQYAVVKPSVNFEKINEVIIIVDDMDEIELEPITTNAD